jgi:transcriptional regulator with XRE-family HTH domain
MYFFHMITSEQSKAARSLLNWSAKDLATRAKVSSSIITKFEKYRATLTSETLQKILEAYRRANVRFMDNSGVMLLQETSEILQGPDCVKQLWERIIDSFEGYDGGEVLVTHVDERRALRDSNADLEAHLQNLEERNISERLLSCEGDTFFLAKPEYYRWISKDLFTLERSTYIFNGCVAIQLWHSNIIIFIRNKKAYEAEKERFESLWASAKIPEIGLKRDKKSS